MEDEEVGNNPLHWEKLYTTARDYEYQGNYQAAIEQYKEIVASGSKEGILEIAKSALFIHVWQQYLTRVFLSIGINCFYG